MLLSFFGDIKKKKSDNTMLDFLEKEDMLNRLIVFVMYLYKTITRKFKRNPRVDSKSMRIHTWYKKIDRGEDNKTQTCVVNWTLTKRSYLVYIEALRITRFGKGNNQTVISYFFESWYYLSPSSFFSFSFLFFFFFWSEVNGFLAHFVLLWSTCT